MMKYEVWFLAATIVLGSCLVPAWGEPAASAAEHEERMLAAGLLAHDRGPMSDRHENGIDLNLEMQFAPLAVFASPRPHLGISANFNGDTSTLYAGVNFRLLQRQQWHVDGILGIAVHDGPLHKDPVGCELDSDCGYGVRYLPRFGAELGYRLIPVGTLSLYYVHMSHKWIIEGENEGLDLIGLRYGRPF
jgi:lipid A 3-O-deacylase